MSGLGPLGASGGAAPVASPLGLASHGVSGPVSGESSPFSVPKTPHLQGSGRASSSAEAGAVGPVRREQLRAELSPRDWAVLQRVAEHRFLTTEQLQCFHFTEHASALTAARTTRRVLARLARDGLLRALPRRQGGPYGGSTPAVWQLAQPAPDCCAVRVPSTTGPPCPPSAS